MGGINRIPGPLLDAPAGLSSPLEEKGQIRRGDPWDRPGVWPRLVQGEHKVRPYGLVAGQAALLL